MPHHDTRAPRPNVCPCTPPRGPATGDWRLAYCSTPPAMGATAASEQTGSSTPMPPPCCLATGQLGACVADTVPRHLGASSLSRHARTPPPPPRSAAPSAAPEVSLPPAPPSRPQGRTSLSPPSGAACPGKLWPRPTGPHGPRSGARSVPLPVHTAPSQRPASRRPQASGRTSRPRAPPQGVQPSRRAAVGILCSCSEILACPSCAPLTERE